MIKWGWFQRDFDKMNKKKVAILVGHRFNSQGAYSPYLNTTEYLWNRNIASKLSDVADIYYRSDHVGLSEGGRIAEVVNRINQKDYNLVISLHFNSFGKDSANGCEVLYNKGNERTKQLGSKFNKLMLERIGIRTRGLIPIDSKRINGGTFVMGCKADAVLLEPFFGSNKQDCDLIKGKEQVYADVIRDIILYL